MHEKLMRSLHYDKVRSDGENANRNFEVREVDATARDLYAQLEKRSIRAYQ